MRPARVASIHAERDAWTRRAFGASVVAAQDLIGATGPIRPHTPIGNLGKDQWGWLVSTAVSAWVSIRAEQATEEGWSAEATIHTLSVTPEPWDVGSVMAILPMLPEACGEGFDWSTPIGEWPKETIAEFLLVAFTLVMRANAARDVVEAQGDVKPINPDLIARQINGVAGKSGNDGRRDAGTRRRRPSPILERSHPSCLTSATSASIASPSTSRSTR